MPYQQSEKEFLQRRNNALRLCHVNSLIWIAPGVINLAFPFNFPIPVAFAFVSSLVGLTIAIPYASVLLGSRLRLARNPSSSAGRAQSIFLALAFASPFLQYYDFFLIRGMTYLGNIGENREIYIASDPSLAGYFALFGLAFSLYFLSTKNNMLGTWASIPWLLNASILLMTGNRQYAALGILLIAYKTLLLRHKSINFGAIVKSIIFIILIFSGALVFQLNRQQFAEGEGIDYIYRITGIQCHDWFCDTPLEIPLAYLYQYFGNIYPGLSFSSQSEISTPLFSLTTPIIYRRIQSLFGGETQVEVVSRILDSIEMQYNIFPAFWTTMYSSVFFELSFIGPIILLITMFLLLTYASSLWINLGDDFGQAIFSIFMAFTGIGLMTLPVSDPVNFFLFIGILTTVIWRDCLLQSLKK
jgi:hypothetical protein